MAGEGLSSAGFTKKTLTTIQDEISQSLKSAFGAQINLLPGSVFATVRDIFSERESQIWDQMQQVYGSQYPDTATGTSLDNLCALTNTTRLPATSSRALAQIFFGTVGTVVPQGTQFSVSGNASAIFSLDSAVTLGAGVNAVHLIVFGATPSSGSVVLAFGAQTLTLTSSDTASTLQSKIQALSGFSGVTVTGSFDAGFTLTYTGSGPTGSGLRVQALPTSSSNTLSNGSSVSVTISQNTAGVPQASGTMTCTATGPNAAPTGTLVTILNPVTGLTSTVNISDATPGTNVETDSALRIRRKSQLQNAGAGTVENIRSKLQAVSGVIQVIVFENPTATTDVNGLPPYSFQAFIQGGADADIAQALWLAKPAGIQSYGTIAQTVLDSAGQSHTVNYSRPVLRNIYAIVNITKNSAWPTDGVTQVQNAILAYAALLAVGQSVLNSSKLLPAIADAVSGIQAIQVLADFTASPAISTNLTININELASFDTSRILVNVT